MEEATSVQTVSVVRGPIQRTRLVSARYGLLTAMMGRVDARGTSGILREVEPRLPKGVSNGTDPEDIPKGRVVCLLGALISFVVCTHDSTLPRPIAQ